MSNVAIFCAYFIKCQYTDDYLLTYYQEINSKDGNYYRRWASVFGPSMSELIDRILKSSKHEEQAFNACAGILHRVKAIPKDIAEEAARKCIEMNSCRYSTYRQVLKKMECDEHPESSPESLPSHENIRGGLLQVKVNDYGIQTERIQL